MQAEIRYAPFELLKSFPVTVAVKKRKVMKPSRNGVLAVQAVGTSLTGTLNATITLICSVDGVNFLPIADTSVLTLDSASKTYIWSKDFNPYAWIGVDIDFKDCTGGTIDVLILNKNTQA